MLRASRCAAVGLLVGLALFAGHAHASRGSLMVMGEAGIDVYIDGQSVGTLPLDAPISLLPGNHQLRCSRPGRVSFEETLFIHPHQELQMQVELMTLRRRESVGLSLIAPGVGQMYLGRTKRGWIHLGAEVTALTSVLVFDILMKSKREDHVRAMEDYRATVDEALLVEARMRAEDALSAMESAQNLRTVSWIAAGAIALYSAFDAWRLYDRVLVDPPQVHVDPAEEEVSLSWSFDF